MTIVMDWQVALFLVVILFGLGLLVDRLLFLDPLKDRVSENQARIMELTIRCEQLELNAEKDDSLVLSPKRRSCENV